jgi:hypothetical protein
LELPLDRRWLLVEPWKSVLAAAVEFVWRTRRSTRIVVPPMSEEWLREHGTDFPKHGDGLY